MGTDKRARQKANRRAAVDHARGEAARRHRTQRLITYGAMALVVVFFIGLVGFLLTRDDDSVVSNEPPPVSSFPFDTTDPAASAPLTTARQGEGPAELPPPGECPPEDGSAEQQLQFDGPPPLCIDPEVGYQAEIETSKGTITVALDTARAPLTVNNFVTLSRYHYYDGSDFHRVINDFMIQGGDPVGEPPGTGGPGYTFADELPPVDYVYQPGELAMANSGPTTNGSQFFIVTRDSGVDWLGGGHTLFGQVTQGMDVVEAIEALDSGDSTPTEEVVIDSITITTIDNAAAGPTTTIDNAAAGPTTTVG